MNDLTTHFFTVLTLGLLLTLTACKMDIPDDANKVHLWLNSQNSSSSQIDSYAQEELLNGLRRLKRISPRRVNKSAFPEGEYNMKIVGSDYSIQLVLINSETIYNESDGQFYEAGELYEILKRSNLVH